MHKQILTICFLPVLWVLAFPITITTRIKYSKQTCANGQLYLFTNSENKILVSIYRSVWVRDYKQINQLCLLSTRSNVVNIECLSSLYPFISYTIHTIVPNRMFGWAYLIRRRYWRYIYIDRVIYLYYVFVFVYLIYVFTLGWGKENNIFI